MAPSTTPVKKVMASNVDLRDPKEILRNRQLTRYQHLSEADAMMTSGERELAGSSSSSDQSNASNMEKDISKMTQMELLTVIADEGEKNRASNKNRPPPSGDPTTWKFEGRLQQLLDAYHAKLAPQEPYLADDVERFCVCNGPEHGLMIECSNGSACLMKWFHFECVGLSSDDFPGEQEDWFCEPCIDNNVGRLRKNAPRSMTRTTVKKPNADRIKNYELLDQAAGEKKKGKNYSKNQKSKARAKEKKEQQKALTINTSRAPTSPGPMGSPGSPGPWTAELDKSFTEAPEVIDTYSLQSLKSAKAALRLRAQHQPATAVIEENDDGGEDDKPEPTPRMKNQGSWAQEEKDLLIASCTEAFAAGHRGEPFWMDVERRMRARGSTRPGGGMRNTWIRGLREQTGLDERRRPNADKMTTAVQTPKRQKAAKSAIPEVPEAGEEGAEEGVEEMDEVEEEDDDDNDDEEDEKEAGRPRAQSA